MKVFKYVTQYAAYYLACLPNDSSSVRLYMGGLISGSNIDVECYVHQCGIFFFLNPSGTPADSESTFTCGNTHLPRLSLLEAA